MTSAGIVRDLFGGELEAASQHKIHVRGTDVGDFLVELDLQLLHEGDPTNPLRILAGDLGAALIPMEIACPPIRYDEAYAIDDLREALRQAGATVEGRIVKAPGGLLREIIQATAPASFIHHARNPAHSTGIGPEHPQVFAPLYGAPNVMQPGGRRMLGTRDDYQGLLLQAQTAPAIARQAMIATATVSASC